MWEKRNPKKYGVSSLSFHGMPILWEMAKPWRPVVILSQV
jgi:hypothetical protein